MLCVILHSHYLESYMTNITINPLLQKDVPILNSIKPDTWASIREIHEHYLRCPGCTSVKAVDRDGRLLGIGTGIAFGQTGWLAHIIVLGEHQRRGIGTRIVEWQIDRLRNVYGCKSVTLTATDQGYPVYVKIGFAEESMYRILERPADLALAGDTHPNVRRIRECEIEAVLRIDRETSGEDRGEFLRPVSKDALVFMDGNEVMGFYLRDFGDGGVSALTEKAGAVLLRERMKDCRKIFIPEENSAGYEYLVSAGYTETKRIHRMILGEPFPRKPALCYSRIGGFAG